MPCRDELRVHLRKEKWLNNLSIISKTNIIEFSEFLGTAIGDVQQFHGLHCTCDPNRLK
ncbi:hypothetical protein T4C_3237 [Trichinella pseudospiralis]|uniref:Uncharacterized protein n=1 Tax=Trichinella pseudospiralis TaxID=6337 RepID=A0A0V1GHJ6_TRIPS|nr:hypothetical protein T4C_3237 [Trichinella pseudospiralis]